MTSTITLQTLLEYHAKVKLLSTVLLATMFSFLKVSLFQREIVTFDNMFYLFSHSAKVVKTMSSMLKNNI